MKKFAIYCKKKMTNSRWNLNKESERNLNLKKEFKHLCKFYIVLGLTKLSKDIKWF